MAWTYADSPATVARDAVRFAVGDVDSADPQPLTDAAVAHCLSRVGVTGSAYPSAAQAAMAGSLAAESLAAYYARQADFTLSKESVSASQRALAYSKLAARLRLQAVQLGGAEVFAGGLTKSGADALDEDADARQPSFRVGQDDLRIGGEPDPLTDDGI